jgi:hypothetical protein
MKWLDFGYDFLNKNHSKSTIKELFTMSRVFIEEMLKLNMIIDCENTY